jgi:hypothetical protein
VKLVQTLVVRDEADVVDAQVAYHLNAGVDFVIAADHESRDATTEILAGYEREGYVRLLRVAGEMRESEWRTRMARLAATEHGADWVINSDAEEFWWPRAESLKDVLAPIPPRYTVVQALRRELVSRPVSDVSFFADGLTARRSAQVGRPGRAALLPVHRADPSVVVAEDRTVILERLVPLRAWYPIEVFDVPVGEAAPADDSPGAALVEDARLRDALRALREAASATVSSRTFALPDDEATHLSFRTPDIVEDAAYAVECAAVGEVDLPRLEQYIEELEQRVAWLEQRLWPRLLRRVARLAGKGGR